jgi:hypothetical protein
LLGIGVPTLKTSTVE